MTANALPMARSAERGVLAPYASYRDSGLPWLGTIPAHWDVRRNGRLFAERVETGFEDLPILEVSLRTGVRVRDMENGARKQQMADRSKYKRAVKGDIAYNMMRMWQGAVGVAPVDGLISPAYVVARPFGEVDPRYYTYLFRTPAYMREVNKFSRGIVSDRNRLYWDEFKQMPSAFPPTEEQSRIADFLDAHGRLTARLIRNKRRLIGLLNEQKQAIINRAVTRGLNPAAPMKPTGIDWMPEVPAHWEVVPLKRVCVLHRGYDLPDDKRIEGQYPVVSSAGVIGTHARAMASGPGVATGRYGSTGKIFYIEEDFWPHNTALYVSQFHGNLPRYVFYLLHTIRYEEHSDKSAVPGIDRKDLHDIRVAKAPLDEQQRITAALDDDLAELGEAIEKIAAEIRLINEYRERLIADVVTGKLDVRHIEIAAPADEPADDGDDAPDEDLDAEGADDVAEAED